MIRAVIKVGNAMSYGVVTNSEESGECWKILYQEFTNTHT